MANERHLSEVKAIMILSVGFYIMGLAVSFFLNIDNSFFAPSGILESLSITLGVFVFSALFFGFLTPLLLLAAGLSHSSMLAENPVSLVFAAQFLVAAYAGTLLGVNALKDLKGDGNLAKVTKKIAMLVVLALALSIVAPLAIEYAPDLVMP